MSLEKTKQIANKIEGYLSEKEGEFLYNTAKICSGRGVIVEIGSWKGRSTIYLAKGSKAGNNIKVYAVDPHQGTKDHQNHKVFNTFSEFKENLIKANVDDIVVPLVKTSEEASKNWQEPIEFLWIDGDHSFPMVKLDFDLWSPYLIKGGIIAFHDAVSGEPKKVVCNFVLKSGKFGNAGLIDTIFYAQKLDTLYFKDKLRNKAIIILLNIYEFFRSLPLPKILRKLFKRIVNKIAQSHAVES
jgi:MMP 1-O-methyltransferase